MKQLKKLREKARRGTALALSVVMVFSLLMSIQPTRANDFGSTGGNSYIREADKNTMDSYIQASLGGWTYNKKTGKWELNYNDGSRYAGEVWADKSVFALGRADGSFDGAQLLLDKWTDGLDGVINMDKYADFLHVFSTLGSSEQITVSGPFDAVFVVDVSGSMAEVSDGSGKRPGETNGKGHTYTIEDTKMYQAMKALDESIASLMEMHDENRCAVVLFASRPYVLMPLAHYEPTKAIEWDAKGNPTKYEHNEDNNTPYDEGEDGFSGPGHLPENLSHKHDADYKYEHDDKGYVGTYISYKEHKASKWERKEYVFSSGYLFDDGGHQVMYDSDDGTYYKAVYRITGKNTTTGKDTFGWSKNDYEHIAVSSGFDINTELGLDQYWDGDNKKNLDLSVLDGYTLGEYYHGEYLWGVFVLVKPDDPMGWLPLTDDDGDLVLVDGVGYDYDEAHAIGGLWKGFGDGKYWDPFNVYPYDTYEKALDASKEWEFGGAAKIEDEDGWYYYAYEYRPARFEGGASGITLNTTKLNEICKDYVIRPEQDNYTNKNDNSTGSYFISVASTVSGESATLSDGTTVKVMADGNDPVMIDGAWSGLWKGFESGGRWYPYDNRAGGPIPVKPKIDGEEVTDAYLKQKFGENYAYSYNDDHYLSGTYIFTAEFSDDPAQLYFDIHASATLGTKDEEEKPESRFHNSITTDKSDGQSTVIGGGKYNESAGDWSDGLDGATSMDAGFWVGMSLLAERDDDDLVVEISGQQVCRTPSLVFLGDGEPTFMMSGMDIEDPALQTVLSAVAGAWRGSDKENGPWDVRWYRDFDYKEDYKNPPVDSYIKNNGWWSFPDPLTTNYYPYGTGSTFHSEREKYYEARYKLFWDNINNNNVLLKDNMYQPENNPDNPGLDYDQYAYESDGGIALATILRAALMKAAVINRYEEAAENKNAINKDTIRFGFYTIGVGLYNEEGNYDQGAALATLDPGTYFKANSQEPVVQEAYEAWKAIKGGTGEAPLHIYSTFKLYKEDAKNGNSTSWYSGNRISNYLKLIFWPEDWDETHRTQWWLSASERFPGSLVDRYGGPDDNPYDVVKSDVFYYAYIDHTGETHDETFPNRMSGYDGGAFFNEGNAIDYGFGPDKGFESHEFVEAIPRIATFTAFPSEGVTLVQSGGSFKATKGKVDGGIYVSEDDFLAIMNEGYTDHYFDVKDASDLSNIFEEIVTLITEEPFQVVGGVNSFNETDSLTYSDPIGEYMTVDSVTDVTLFGHHYKVKMVETGLNYEQAKGYIPTLADKQNGTTYTIYQIVSEDGKTLADTTRPNLSLGGDTTFDLREDIQIWVENDGGSETLYINISVNALPTQVANIYMDDITGKNLKKYTTNLSETAASTPLRVFYNVSLQEGTYTDDGQYLANLKGIDEDYLGKNKGVFVYDSSDGFYNKAEGEEQGPEFVAFYSTIYSGEEYKGYPVVSETSMGDAKVTFSVGEENQFYRFQKNRVLFLIPGTYDPKDKIDRPAEIDLTSLLENKNPNNYEELLAALNEARANVDGKGTKSPFWAFGDCVAVDGGDGISVDLPNGHNPTDEQKENFRNRLGGLSAQPQIDSNNWYYIIREFYDTTESGAVVVRYMAIARKGSEFGTGVRGKMGSEVEWYNPDKGDTKPFDENKETYGKPSDGDAWYVSAKPGGLRVGGLANFAGVKGYKIREGVSDGDFTKDKNTVARDNVTETANTYFLPTISSNISGSGGVSAVVVDVYLGNNGRILLPTKETGNLTVSKTVTGNAGDKTKEFSFTVTLGGTYAGVDGELHDASEISGTYGDMTFTNGKASFKLKHGEEKTARDLPAGITYTVTEAEANQDGYTTTQDGAEGAIPADDTATAEFTNSKSSTTPTQYYGNLTVSKTVTGTGGDKTKPFLFTLTLKNSDGTAYTGSFTSTGADLVNKGNGVYTFELADGDELKITRLPEGVTYTVIEDEANQNGYITTPGTGEREGTIPANGEAKAEFVNAYQIVSLTIKKTVENADGSDLTDEQKDQDFFFTVTLTPPEGKLLPEPLTVSGEGSLKENDDGTYTVTLKNGEELTIEGLPVGTTYSVVEAEVEGYASSGAVGEEQLSENKAVEITNIFREETGSLTVTKTVTGNGGDKTKQFTFTVTLSDTSINGEYGEMTFVDGSATFTLKDNESKTASNLPAGIEYTVTEAEADQDGYETTNSGSTGTIPSGGTATASFTNTKEEEIEPGTGGLIVSKIVGGSTGDKTRAFHFAVVLSDSTINGTYGGMTFVNGVARFTLRHGESVTATGLPSGITYSVMEQEANQDGYFTASKGRDGTIPDQGAAQAAFFNTKGEPQSEDPPLEEFDDPEIPLAGFPDFPDVPQTGDNSGIWLVLGLLSALGLGVLYLSRPRRKDKME